MAGFTTINDGLADKDMGEMGIRREPSSTVSKGIKEGRQPPTRSGALNGGKKWSKDDMTKLYYSRCDDTADIKQYEEIADDLGRTAVSCRIKKCHMMAAINAGLIFLEDALSGMPLPKVSAHMKDESPKSKQKATKRKAEKQPVSDEVFFDQQARFRDAEGQRVTRSEFLERMAAEACNRCAVFRNANGHRVKRQIRRSLKTSHEDDDSHDPKDGPDDPPADSSAKRQTCLRTSRSPATVAGPTACSTSSSETTASTSTSTVVSTTSSQSSQSPVTPSSSSTGTVSSSTASGVLATADVARLEGARTLMALMNSETQATVQGSSQAESTVFNPGTPGAFAVAVLNHYGQGSDAEDAEDAED